MTNDASLKKWLSDNEVSQNELGRRVGCTGEHINRVVKGDPRVSQVLALKIFDETGIRVGPLSGLSNPEIAVIRRVNAQANAGAAA